MKAAFDAPKWEFLFRTCKKLRHLEIQGSGVIGDSLTGSLHLAQSLDTISVSTNCEISVSAVQLALKTCQKSLIEATFLRVKGSSYHAGSGQWPKLESLKTLRFRASGALLNIVSVDFSSLWVHKRGF
jgi:F-box/TPR repeat protein Pof3